MDHGAPIAYTVLSEGTPVLTAAGGEVGTVKRVLADEGTDIFDGITIDVDGTERFVDASQIDTLYEQAVVLSISGDEASGLPEHSPSPAVLDVDADDVAEEDGPTRGFMRRAWDRISGNY